MSRYRLLIVFGVMVLLIGAAVSGLPPTKYTVNELSDAELTLGFVTPAGPAVQVSDLTCAVHDLETETALWTPATFTPTTKKFKVLIPGSANSILRPGFCSVTATTPCNVHSDCPSGEQCQYAASERHVLSCLWHWPGGGGTGQGTWETQFDVLALRFLP